jgi:hypothetical protein
MIHFLVKSSKGIFLPKVDAVFDDEQSIFNQANLVVLLTRTFNSGLAKGMLEGV